MSSNAIKRGDIMHGDEKTRSEILLAYVDGSKQNPEHSLYIINELESVGYLVSGIDHITDARTLKTTELGIKYLKTCGINVKNHKKYSNLRKITSLFL